MASLAARAMMGFRNEERSVHPFFEKRTKSQDRLPLTDNPQSFPNNAPSKSLLTSSGDILSICGTARGPGEATQVPPAFAVNGMLRSRHNSPVGCDPELLEVDPNLSRRKRQKSSSPRQDTPQGESPSTASAICSLSRDGHQVRSDTFGSTARASGNAADFQPEEPYSLVAMVRHTVPGVSEAQYGPSPANIKENRIDLDSSALVTPAPSSEEVHAPPPFTDTSASSASKPRKTLRLNPKTGTIGSPPAKKPSSLSSVSGNKDFSGKGSKKSGSLIIIIKYGFDGARRSAVGNHINLLMNGTQSLASLQSQPRISPKPIPQAKPQKSTHPFFLGKTTLKVPVIDENDMVTTDLVSKTHSPGSKASMKLDEPQQRAPLKWRGPAVSIPAFQGFGNATKILKFPGAVEACWPPSEMVHVRGEAETGFLREDRPEVVPPTERKSKYASTETTAQENILNILVAKLKIPEIREELRNIDSERFLQPEKSLRIPEKHFQNGFKIQRRVKRELSIKLSSSTSNGNSTSSEDELLGDGKRADRINPLLLKLFSSFPTSLTAFDRSQYETQSWIHKYAPSNTAEVLQSGKEPIILKEWLGAMTILAIDQGGSEIAQSRANSVSSRRSRTPPREKSVKTKRKSKNLGGFVVSSDEEEDRMDEISEPEGDSSAPESGVLMKRTVVRSGNSFGRNPRELKKVKNAIVVSGPSGCGKTAMVYGIAKELEFEVFEINSSCRRSGKEILEKVGDMTRNHLVHRSEEQGTSSFGDENTELAADALAADIKSGRQGTMNSFFKPKKATSAESKSKSSIRLQDSKEAIKDAKKSSKSRPKQTKQSLILLEEVDILFAEDKNFWATVVDLIAQSKRPVIMTCNDETLLPLQILPLHAIIRLSPPPQDLAVDYMLLVAAAEGHIVKRKAIKTLYEARGYDLRGSMTELNYWCQLGVGDCKGGLDWFYPRWPPGSDIDEHGKTIRVLSEGTYKTGMGWIGRDFNFERYDDHDVKEEVLREAWDGWQIDLGDWHDSLALPSVMVESPGQTGLASLSSYETFADCMSVADVCACRSLATGNQALLDTSSPPVPAKVHDDFVIGYEFLQADILSPFNHLDRDISIWIKSQTRHILQSNGQPKLKAPSEAQISAKIASAGQGEDGSITRRDFSAAFDPLADPESGPQNTTSLLSSVFDRTTSMIAVDVAPFVRSIVANDARMQQERTRLSNLLSEGGRKSKRQRTTRSALSALEGGTRRTTRPEKYFRVALNTYLVNKTGMLSWHNAVAAEMSSDIDGPQGSSPGTTETSLIDGS